MATNHNELLSVLVDGELDGDELEQALQILYTDKQARKQWQRYQLASDVLHGHGLLMQGYDLTDKVSTVISAEPGYRVQQKPKFNVRFFPDIFSKQAISLAAAASLGALAVVGIMDRSENQLMPSSQVAISQQDTDDRYSRQAQTEKRWTVGEEEVEQRLNTYLADHNVYSGSPNVFSYARVVSHSEGQ